MYCKLFCTLALVSFMAVANAELPDISNTNLNDIDVDQIQQQLASKNITVDRAKALVREKCIKVAGPKKGDEIYNEIEGATTKLSECAMTLVNYTAIQKEIEEASPNGELDAVFNKYCNKQPEALACIESFNDKLKPCLDEEERSHQDVFLRITKSLLNFVCHKGGDQIALFIAEKGPECLDSQKEHIQQCINSTFSGYLPKDKTGAVDLDNVNSLPKFIMGRKQCAEMESLEACVVKHLEDCTEITPANIVESLFRFIKKETICNEEKSSTAKHSAEKNGANSQMMQSWMSVVVVAALATAVRRA